MSCTDGTIQELIDFGIQQKEAGFIDYCLRDKTPDFQQCNEKFLDESKFRADFQAICLGQKECTITNSLNYIKKVGAPATCTDVESTFFLQVGCKFSEAEVKDRQTKGLIISCTGVLIALVFIITVDYMQAFSALQVTQWDVDTVTVGDYSAEMQIPDELYDNFVRDVYPTLNTTESKGEAFKNFLLREIEGRCSKLPNQGFEDDEVHVKIALLTLVFQNAALIKKLQARGGLIKNMKHEAVRKADLEIDQFRHDNAEKLNRPIAAFITWESEEGIQRCVNYQELANNQPELKYLLGVELDFDGASEPTDIIWENRELTDGEKRKRTIKAIAIVSTMLLFCFLIIVFLKKATGIFTAKYQSRIDCGSILETHSKQIKKEAIQDWYSYKTVVGYKQKGFLQCFCQNEAKQTGKSIADVEYYDANASDFDNKPIESAQICHEYSYDMFFSSILGSTIKYTLIILNHYLKIYVAMYISAIGDKTHSTRLKKVTLGTFLAMFFNLALILLLVNSDFRDSGLPLSSVFNKGYNDFTSRWYQNVGYQIIDTMVYNSFFPFVIFAFQMSKVMYARCLDRGLNLDPYRTKKTSVMQYVELYSGPEYAIHAKYSINLLVAYVCMMYGLGIPLLFFVATMTYMVLWTIERIMVCYVCTLPPSFDQSLNKNSLSILKWAVLFYLAFGYWMVDAPRIFGNEVLHRDTPSSSQRTEHIIFKSLSINQSVPMLLCLIFGIAITFGRGFFKKQLKQWGYRFEKPLLNVDENIPNYWESLKYGDQLWLIKENQQMKENYFFNIISEKSEALIKTGGHAKKKIQGCPFYFVLANSRYANTMSFVPVCTVNRKELIIDEEDDENDEEQSDMVTILFNLAYLPEKSFKMFCFKPGFTNDFKKNAEELKSDFEERQKSSYNLYEKMALQVSSGYTPPQLGNNETTSGLMGTLVNKKEADDE